MYIIIAVLAVAGLVTIDRLIKNWAVAELEPVGTMDFITIGKTKIIDLYYLENGGAMFGSLFGKRLFLIIITSIFLVLCAVWLYKDKCKSKLLYISLILIIAGGIGNLIDRIFHDGMVVDYFEVKLFHFAIFNFADCLVTVGIALIIIHLIIDEIKEKNNKNK